MQNNKKGTIKCIHDIIDILDDSDFKRVYKHPDKIKCKDCVDYENNRCKNTYFEMIVNPESSCKNGKMKKMGITIETKPKLFQKIKCLFGNHNEEWLGKFAPYIDKILLHCPCCNKYGIYDMTLQSTSWYKKEDIAKEVSSECLEMMNKYNMI